MYLASQIFEILAIIITLLSYHLKTKKRMFKGMCISNILDIMHFLFLSAYSGCITKIVALIRNLFIIKKESNKKLDKKIYLVLFIILYIILAILTFKNIFSILPLLAAIIYLLICWNGNEVKVQQAAILCDFLWLIYCISILSVAGIIANILAIISTSIAYYNQKRTNKN